MYSEGLFESELHVVAEPVSHGTVSYDFVALHGFGGDWKRTWTSDSGFNWLRQSLAVKYPHCRVLAYQCPNLLKDLANDHSKSIEHIIFALVENRRAANRTQNPLVFISHSFGGILAKVFFNATHTTKSPDAAHRTIYECISAFVFLGTPHKHHVPVHVEGLWRSLDLNCDDSLGGTVSDLRTALENASRINDEFFRLGGENVPSFCFYELEKQWVGIDQIYLVPKDKAVLRTRPTDCQGLSAKHYDLPKFEGQSDHNFVKFTAAFDSLIVGANDSTRKIESTQSSTRGLRLLSLDGGGVKGLFSALILQRILEEVHKLEGSNRRKLPCEYFDLIGGTSTGGLLAIMLGRLQMDIGSCIRTYRSMSVDLFQRNDWLPLKKIVEAGLGMPWFSGERLKNAICATVDQYVSPEERASMNSAGLCAENLRLFSAEHNQKTRCFVCAVREGQHEADIIRSYRPQPPRGYDTSSYTIWQAARATSAAPMYFPAIVIQGYHYFDGGLSCNNPVLNVLDEARAEFPDSPISAIVTIGTGKAQWVDPHGPVPNIIFSVINRATNTEMPHDRIMNRAEYDDLRGGYFRFQEDDGLKEIDLADSKKLAEIETLAHRYLAKEDVQHMIRSCAQRLMG